MGGISAKKKMLENINGTLSRMRKIEELDSHQKRLYNKLLYSQKKLRDELGVVDSKDSDDEPKRI